jgi:hypothetical protein
LSRRTLVRGCRWKSSKKTRGRWKISIVWTSLFIGARRVVSRSCLDSTVASFPGDACPLRRSEGDIFYQSSKVFVETDRRSQPASPRG